MNSAAEQCYGFESNPVAPGLCAGCHEPKEGHPVRVTASVREISHEVRIDLTDAPPLKLIGDRRRKPVGLRIRYGIGRSVHRVDITVEFRNSAEHFPPVGEMPEWMRRIVEANRPADVDSPDDDRRTGMGGWPLGAPEIPGSDDPDALHALVVRGLRAIGFGPEEAALCARSHQRDVVDLAAESIDGEAWSHEKPEHENQTLYRLADKIRGLRLPGTP